VIGAGVAWPVLVRAQKRLVVGVLVPANPEPFFGVLKRNLHKRGYAEGPNLRLELRSADGKPDRLAGLAAELVAMKVDVLVAHQTPAATAAKRATTEIPIVMLSGDPLATGLISSLARPGGNVTGVSATTAALGGKTMELIRELMPSAKRAAILANAADPFTRTFLQQLEEAAPALEFTTRAISVQGPGRFQDAFDDFVKWRADAVIVQPSLPRAPLVLLALKHRLAAISPTPLFPEAGGLMSYAAANGPLYDQVAAYVERVFKGAKPGELPVHQPNTFELVINLKTARALGLSVPRSLLLRADKVIE
jgi:putative tryptophan/tyrosine transport system substrate-binding protein